MCIRIGYRKYLEGVAKDLEINFLLEYKMDENKSERIMNELPKEGKLYFKNKCKELAKYLRKNKKNIKSSEDEKFKKYLEDSKKVVQYLMENYVQKIN